ncbi:ectoine hydroxylase [Rickettsiales bacterium]|nr:ectoine hydroxylase [Rickettsiales bacterium]
MTAINKKIEDFDPYSSRFLDTPFITTRKDPVIYGDKSEGVLSVNQLEQYEKDGFLFFENMFNEDEVNFLLDEVENLKQAGKVPEDDFIIREPESNEIRSFFYIHEFNPIFRKLSQDPRIVNIAQQILNSQLYIHQSRVNLKPGFKGKEFYWHSDFETWHVEDGMPRMRALSCSITLTDNNEFNGPLMVIPGSHKQYVSCVGQTPDEHYKDSLRKQEYGVPDCDIIADFVKERGISSPKGKAGSVIFFECNLMHGSNGNITPYPRTNVFFVYNSLENKLVEPFGGMKSRPEHIAARKRCTPVNAKPDAEGCFTSKKEY